MYVSIYKLLYWHGEVSESEGKRGRSEVNKTQVLESIQYSLGNPLADKETFAVCSHTHEHTHTSIVISPGKFDYFSTEN